MSKNTPTHGPTHWPLKYQAVVPVSTPPTDDVDDEKDGEKRSKELKGLLCAEKRVSKAARTLSDAVAEGFDTYKEKRDKRANDTKDGALVYFGDNVAKALEKAQKEAAPALPQLLRSNKRGRKSIRKAAKQLVGFIPFLR